MYSENPDSIPIPAYAAPGTEENISPQNSDASTEANDLLSTHAPVRQSTESDFAADAANEPGRTPDAAPVQQSPYDPAAGSPYMALSPADEANSPAPASSSAAAPTPDTAALEQREIAPAPRDRTAEWQELVEAHPELVGKQLPEDIYQACVHSDEPPLRIYESMMLRRLGEELEALRKENDVLRRNAETALRAPVTGATGSSAPESRTEDPFIRAFRGYR